MQVPGQLGSVGAGALDADCDQVAARAQPGQQSLVAGRSGGERLGGQVPADRVDDGGLVGVGVGVDSADDGYGLVCRAGPDRPSVCCD
jgi:hypothetical protein